MEGGEVVVLARDTRIGSRVGVEYLFIDSLGRVDAALDHGDLAVKGVTDVGAGLRASPLVEI